MRLPVRATAVLKDLIVAVFIKHVDLDLQFLGLQVILQVTEQANAQYTAAAAIPSPCTISDDLREGPAVRPSGPSVFVSGDTLKPCSNAC